MKGDAEQSIMFAGSWHYATERFRFYFLVADLYKDLERLIGSADDLNLVPAIGNPIHLLRDDRSLSYWYLDDAETIPSVLEQIDLYGIPFLDKFANLPYVKECLESDPLPSIIGLPADARIQLLAAILAYEEKLDEAIELVQNAIDERKGARPDKHWRLEEFRTRLEGIASRGK